MSKKVLFSIAMVTVFAFSFTSCVEKEDLEMLKHPIHLQGTFNPNLGVPLGQAHLSIEELLSMFKQTNGIIQVDENDVVTVAFDTVFDTHTDINRSKSRRHRYAPGDTVDLFSQHYQGQLPIDLFENMDGVLSEDDFQVGRLSATLTTLVKAQASAQTEALMAHHSVTAMLDSLTVRYQDKNGGWHKLNLADSQIVVPAHELTDPMGDGCLVKLLDSTDLSEIINARPRMLTYNMRFSLSTSVTELLDIDPSEFILDSLEIRAFDLHSHMGVEFPLALYLRGIEYGVDLDLDLNQLADLTEQYSASLEESHLYLEMSNMLPLGFELKAEMRDGSGTTLCPVTGSSNTTIGGAQTTYDAVSGTYFATAPTVGLIDLVLDQQTMNSLRNTRKIHIDSKVFTSDPTNPSKPRVSIRKSDMMTVRAYLQLHPTVTIDIPILNQ